uniref:Pheromone a factor receptor n=1 Tax=Morchella sp. Mes-21 TaxID=1175521 RepID=A0A1C6ZTP7_9PEZI|nr:pheromone a factor receptor [Morchella sp. Mes-21]
MAIKILFLIVCFIAIIITPVPLRWLTNPMNVPAICLICWITIFNTISFINALIWGGNDDQFETSWKGAIFCDIEIKFIIASSAGMMAATTAMSRNLARVMEQTGPLYKTKSVRRRELIQDLLICFWPPIYLMSVHYIVQPNRYYIVRYVGCTPSVDNSWPTIPLIYIWPPIIGFAAAYYASRSIYLVRNYQKKFSEDVNSSISGASKSRFMRLFIISTFMVSINFPIVLYIFYHNLKYPMIPYSWHLVHTQGWGYIPYIKNDSIQFDHWIPAFAGIVCFIFFGTGREATQIYKRWFEAVGLGAYFPDLLLRKKALIKTGGGSSMGSWVSRKLFSSFSTS